MLAFVGTTVSKAEIIAQLEAHARADEIMQGIYWENGRGCAVGCTIHGSDHAEYESRFGIPQMLARLEDRIFEGMDDSTAKAWPLRFMGAIKPGSDLSLIGWQFLHWLLIDKTVNPGIEHELVRDAVRQCADVLALLAKGASAESAESVAWSAASAASAARSVAASAASAAYALMAAKLVELIEAPPIGSMAAP